MNKKRLVVVGVHKKGVPGFDIRKNKMFRLKLSEKGVREAAKLEEGFDIHAGYIPAHIIRHKSGINRCSLCGGVIPCDHIKEPNAL